MDAADQHVPCTRAWPSGFALMLGLLALVAGSKAILYDTLDPDCFWHLRVADQLQRDGVGPIVDEISFASLKTPWTPYSWLAELGMKRLWDRFGWRAAVFAQAVMVAGVVVLVGLACRERAGPMPAVVAAAVAMYWCLPYLSFRPATMSILLVALCAWLILRDRTLGQRSWAVWWAVPITALNANVHFFAMLVPALVIAMLIESVSEREPGAARRYSLMLACTAAASIATPILPGVLRTVFFYQTSDPALAMGFIAEARPFYSGSLGPVSVAVLVATCACAFLNRRRLSTGERMWILLGVALLFRMGRLAPLYALLTAPALAATLPALRSGVLDRRAVRAVLAFVLLIGITRAFVAFPRSDVPLDAWLNRHGDAAPGYPCAAAEFVASNTSGGRILNEFSWGGYLAWRLGERYQVLMDGRTQLYAPEFWHSMYVGQTSAPTSMLREADAGAAILPAGTSRLRDSLIMLGWRRVHRDDRAEVLVPPDRAVAGSRD